MVGQNDWQIGKNVDEFGKNQDSYVFPFNR